MPSIFKNTSTAIYASLRSKSGSNNLLREPTQVIEPNYNRDRCPRHRFHGQGFSYLNARLSLITIKGQRSNLVLWEDWPGGLLLSVVRRVVTKLDRVYPTAGVLRRERSKRHWKNSSCGHRFRSWAYGKDSPDWRPGAAVAIPGSRDRR